MRHFVSLFLATGPANPNEPTNYRLSAIQQPKGYTRFLEAAQALGSHGFSPTFANGCRIRSTKGIQHA
jgi:hypothetical protein